MDNEIVYKLMQNPNRKDFANLLIDNQGELDNLDFKREWIEFSKIARIMLGMANIGGGLIIFGLDEKKDGSIERCGLKNLMDKADINNKIEKYIPESFKYEVNNFDFRDENVYQKVNGMYQIIVVKSEARDLPYILSRQIVEDDRGVIYVRRGTRVAHANSVDIARMIEKKINASIKESSLKLDDHLAQLRVLYQALYYNVDLPQYMPNFIMKTLMGNGLQKKPDESYNDFILSCIEEKKNIIKENINR